MTIFVLVCTILTLVLMAGLAFLVFGREELRVHRERRFARQLSRHAPLVARIRTAAAADFDRTQRDLAAISDPLLCEAVLEEAHRGAGAEAAPFFVSAYEHLGIVDRYLSVLETSPHWGARAHAAQQLGQFGSSRAVPALLRVIRDLKDEDDDVRGAALRALGRIRDPRALPDLIAALGSPESSLPPRLAEIIVLFGTDAVQPLIQELRNLDSDTRRMWAAEILGCIGDPRAAVPLIESLGDVHPEVRAKSAGALGKLADERAVEKLLEMLLLDPIPFVRTRVAQALGALGHPKVIDHMICVLKDAEWWVRIRAVEALEQIGKNSIPALLIALQDGEEEVTRRAAGALERMGYVEQNITILDREGFRPDVYKVLVMVGRAGVTGVLLAGVPRLAGRGQELLVRMLGDIGDAAAGPVLRGLLAHAATPALQSRLAQALGKIGCREAIPELLGGLAHRDEWVRQATAEALGRLGAGDYLDDLIRLLKDPIPGVRQTVCGVVAAIDDPRAAAAIAGLLRDPAAEVRIEALRALRRGGSSDYENPVCALLSDPFDSVRIEAAAALSQIGGPASIDAVLDAARAASDPLVEALSRAVARCHTGSFTELRARIPGAPSRQQVVVLLDAASRCDGEARREFVAGCLTAADPWHRTHATRALGGFPVLEAAHLLEGPLCDPDAGVRDAAVLTAALHRHEALFERLAECTADPQAAVRFHVALALGIDGRLRFQGALLGLAQDAEPVVRAGAALGLALHNVAELAPHVRRFALDAELCEQARRLFVADSADPLIAMVVQESGRRNLMETRLFLGGSRYALEKELIGRAREALSAEERVRALEVCKVVASGQSYTAALSIMKNDPSPEVRTRALELIVTVRRDSEAATVAGGALLDPHPEVRLRAASILGELEVLEAVAALVHALDTPDRDLREAVTTSLSVHLARNPEQAEALLHEIPSTRTRKLGMVWLFGKTRSGNAMKTLLAYLEDEDGDVRAAAVGALAKYKAPGIAQALRQHLSDPNARVRAAIVNTFGRSRARDAATLLERMLIDPDGFVRQRAAVALFKLGAVRMHQGVRAIETEAVELRPVWAAAGLLLGELAPDALAAYPGAAEFLRELFPPEEAQAAIRESADPARRTTAFRVLQVLAGDGGNRVAAALAGDPDPGLRREAAAVLQTAGAV